MRMGKKAQFYLIAAIIIIVIVFGIFTVSNYARTEKKDSVVYDLQKEFGLESGKIEDFILYNKYESSDYIGIWTQMYVYNKGQELDNFIVIYGNETQITMLNYTKSPDMNICLGNSCYWNMTTTTFARGYIAGDKFQIVLGNATYDFKLEPGKNFAFLIKEGEFIAQ